MDNEKKISSFGGTWEEYRREHFTPEEIAESDLRVAILGELIKARREKGLTQKELGEMCGIKQPIIARLEGGGVTPNLNTVLKVLNSLGKTLAVVDLPSKA